MRRKTKLIKQCLEMAMKLAEVQEENKELFLHEGDVLPAEYIFIRQQLIEFIKYCQNKSLTADAKFKKNYGQIKVAELDQHYFEDLGCLTCVHRDVFALDPPCWGCEDENKYEPIIK